MWEISPHMCTTDVSPQHHRHLPHPCYYTPPLPPSAHIHTPWQPDPCWFLMMIISPDLPSIIFPPLSPSVCKHTHTSTHTNLVSQGQELLSISDTLLYHILHSQFSWLGQIEDLFPSSFPFPFFALSFFISFTLFSLWRH